MNEKRQSTYFPKQSIFFLCCAFSGLLLSTLPLYQHSIDWHEIAAVLTAYAGISAAAIYDYGSMLIPNWIPLSMLASRMILFGIEAAFLGAYPQGLLGSAAGFLLTSLLLLIASRLSKGGVGAGDVKLFAATGFVCGLNTSLSVLLISLIVCAVAGGLTLLWKKDRTARDKMPFAPFIWAGFVLYMMLLYR